VHPAGPTKHRKLSLTWGDTLRCGRNSACSCLGRSNAGRSITTSCAFPGGPLSTSESELKVPAGRVSVALAQVVVRWSNKALSPTSVLKQIPSRPHGLLRARGAHGRPRGREMRLLGKAVVVVTALVLAGSGTATAQSREGRRAGRLLSRADLRCPGQPDQARGHDPG
jgi:hypothetical protein